MESSAASPNTGRVIEARTIADAFRRTVAARADEVAIRTKDDEVSWTWSELAERSDAIAGGLAQLGLGHADTLAIMLANRPEFHAVDLAAMTLGAVPFSIYQTYTPDQIAYVVGDAQARIIVTEQSYLATVLAAREQLPGVEHVIVIDGEAPAGTTAIADVAGADPDFDADAHWRAIEPDDVLTLIYTSGTTGPPKGVQLMHSNLLAAVAGIDTLAQFPANARVISWLPAAHIAERAAHHYLPIVFGFTVTTCPDPRQVLSYLPLVKPHWFFAVPRIWEKLKAGLETMLAGQPAEQRAKVEEALADATRKVRLEQAGEPVPEELAAAVALADAETFSNLRAFLGFDAIAAVNVGAAPTSIEVIEFFHAIGIPLAELWGMSETCGAGTCNPSTKIKIGTVGPPLPGVEITLADDGEVLIRGGIIMLGYRNLPEQTAETIDSDGWLHTGDIGTIDDDGYLTLVDRKKEIIINAAGKNMSPANIESTLKGASSLIGQAAVIGDRRPFNTALIVLDADFAPMWAGQNAIEQTDLPSLAVNDQVRAAVQEAVDDANAKLARVEQIKRFEIVRGDWLPGGDELTPTMKLKRKPIAEKYSEMIEAMYVR